MNMYNMYMLYVHMDMHMHPHMHMYMYMYVLMCMPMLMLMHVLVPMFMRACTCTCTCPRHTPSEQGADVRASTDGGSWRGSGSKPSMRMLVLMPMLMRAPMLMPMQKACSCEQRTPQGTVVRAGTYGRGQSARQRFESSECMP